MALDDAWTVLHSVGWQSERFGRPGDGEADFVLLNRRGVIVLEVKGGAVSLVDGAWQSISGGGTRYEIKDPFQQALQSRKALSRYLEERIPEAGKVRTGHGVCLPDVRVDAPLGPEGPREIVIDRQDLDDIGPAIGRLVAHWRLDSALDAGRLKRIRDLLAPTVTVKPLLADTAADVEKELIRLTDQQIAVLQGLRRYRRMLIYGGAGTGKTVLAMAHARRLASEGFKVLLLCFNEPLGHKLKTEFVGNERVTATHLHSFAVTVIASAGHRPPTSPAPRWWDEELPEIFEKSVDSLSLDFSALVIDEGQDFHPNWWVPLQLMLTDPDESPCYVFADIAQQLYQPGWTPPFDREPFELMINCRNTLSIAGCVSRVVGLEIPVLGIVGPKPKFVAVRREEEIPAAVGRIVHGLHEDGFGSHQIAVLTTSRDLRETLKAMQLRPSVGDQGLDDDVVVETVHRFKGLESDVVVLVLSGPMFADPALAYVGMSRAKLMLLVVGTEAGRKAVNWD